MSQSPPKNAQILTATPLFSGVDPATLEDLAPYCSQKSYEDGQILFHAGDRADGFYIVVEGCLEVFRSGNNLREQTLHLLREGEMCGEVPLFSGGTYPATARAREQLRAMFVPGDAFMNMAHRHPEMLLEMLAVLSKRLRHFTNIIADLSLRDVQARLANHLLQLTKDQGSEVVTLESSKRQLATTLGTIPETLSRALAKLAASKVVTIDGSTITVHRPDALREIVDASK
ncbi:MAG: Crp/Fnr family transcriptional regulator [Planctomycetia bacterium]